MHSPFGKVAYPRLLTASQNSGIFVIRNSGGRVAWLGPAASAWLSKWIDTAACQPLG